MDSFSRQIYQQILRTYAEHMVKKFSDKDSKRNKFGVQMKLSKKSILMLDNAV